MPRKGQTKLTPERREMIRTSLEAGNTRRAACAAAGISEDSFANWLRRFSEFSDAIKKAEAVAETAHVATIATAGREGTWQASAWWLERRRPDDWGKRDRVEAIHSGPDGGPIPVRHDVSADPRFVAEVIRLLIAHDAVDAALPAGAAGDDPGDSGPDSPGLQPT